MAFDAAAAGGPKRPAPGAVELNVQGLSQRVFTLAQATNTLETLAAALGSAADTVSHRQRVTTAENAGMALQKEIDDGLRTLRTRSIQTGSDHTMQKQLKMLEQQYAGHKAKFATVATNARMGMRQYEPRAAAVVDASAKARAAKRKEAEIAAQQEVMIEMTPFTEVDASIIAEKNREALAIAQASAELGRVVQDVATLVNEQGETLNVVEANVDKALEKTEAAVEELTVASSYASSYRKKCALFWALFIVAAALITIPLVLHHFGKQV